MLYEKTLSCHLHIEWNKIDQAVVLNNANYDFIQSLVPAEQWIILKKTSKNAHVHPQNS